MIPQMTSHRTSLRLKLKPIELQPAQRHVGARLSPSFSDLTSIERLDSRTSRHVMNLARNYCRGTGHLQATTGKLSDSHLAPVTASTTPPLNTTPPYQATLGETRATIEQQTLVQHRRETYATAVEANEAQLHTNNPNRTKLLQESHRPFRHSDTCPISQQITTRKTSSQRKPKQRHSILKKNNSQQTGPPKSTRHPLHSFGTWSFALC